MKARLGLIFPYCAAALVLGAILLLQKGGDVETVTAEVPACCAGEEAEGGLFRDPVCQMDVSGSLALELDGVRYGFCTEQCRELFKGDPGHYLTERCLVCKAEDRFTPVGEGSLEATFQERVYRFCGEEHRQAFRSDAAGYFLHTMWGIPGWLYYGSIALVLILSFGIIEFRNGRTEAARPGAKDTSRFDLFGAFPWLKSIFRAPATRFFAQAGVVALFLLVLAAGLFGNQLPQKNLAPLLTWTIWWCGLVLLILFAGKAWCYVCPWDAIASWAEKKRLFGRGGDGMSLKLKWPRILRNIWPATILFVGLTWIELGFGVTNSPRATAWLGLAMLGLAFVSAFVFDRKSFCRYGCLVGRISGLYALFSPVEIRARDPDACRTCKSKACYLGSEKGEPCPTFQYLGSMRENTYCISCMECVKTCDKDNVALNLRPWGADLTSKTKSRSDEAYLALLMLALTGFHGLTMTAAWRDVTGALESALGLGSTLSFSLGMLAIMTLPIVLYAGLVFAAQKLAHEPGKGYREFFTRYAYALLPIALFYHLAHNAEHLLMEGQKVAALASDPLGREWDLFGTATKTLEPLIDLPTLWILQVGLVLFGHVFSLAIARKTAGALFTSSRAATRSQIPMLVAMILFSLMSLWLLKQPMEMRTSAM